MKKVPLGNIVPWLDHCMHPITDGEIERLGEELAEYAAPQAIWARFLDAEERANLGRHLDANADYGPEQDPWGSAGVNTPVPNVHARHSVHDTSTCAATLSQVRVDFLRESLLTGEPIYAIIDGKHRAAFMITWALADDDDTVDLHCILNILA